jgi:hypothetical protein
VVGVFFFFGGGKEGKYTIIEFVTIIFRLLQTQAAVQKSSAHPLSFTPSSEKDKG